MPTVHNVHKKLFCDYTDVHPKIIVHNWNPDEDRYVQLKRLLHPHVSQVCVPTDLMRKLVKMAALHDGWDVTEINLSDAYSEEETELRRTIQKARDNRGYFIALLDLLSALDEDFISLAVEAMTIADENGNSIRVRVDGELIETGNAAELESAVKQVILHYMGHSF